MNAPSPTPPSWQWQPPENLPPPKKMPRTALLGLGLGVAALAVTPWLLTHQGSNETVAESAATTTIGTNDSALASELARQRETESAVATTTYRSPATSRPSETSLMIAEIEDVMGQRVTNSSKLIRAADKTCAALELVETRADFVAFMTGFNDGTMDGKTAGRVVSIMAKHRCYLDGLRVAALVGG